MGKKLKIEKFKQYFEQKGFIFFQDVVNFYHANEPLTPHTTINWRIYKLVQLGVLKRVGKGLYQLGESKIFIPATNGKMQKIETLLKDTFPFAAYCQWDLSLMNSFLHHLINFNILFVDVEKDAVDAAYNALREKFTKVMAVQNLYDELSNFKDYIIVRPLVSEAPIQKIGKIYTATLEKILVDLAVDKEFMLFQGSEIYAIFESVFEQYTINQNTLLRYASRKNKRKEIEKIITINRQ
jgi:DNA-binding Lrp family transcriptional regulator